MRRKLRSLIVLDLDYLVMAVGLWLAVLAGIAAGIQFALWIAMRVLS